MSDTYSNAAIPPESLVPGPSSATNTYGTNALTLDQPAISAVVDPKQGQPDLMKLLGPALQPPDPMKLARLHDDLTDIAFRKSEAVNDRASENQRIYEQNAAQMQSAYDAEQATINSTPKWDVDAERKKFQTNPIESFGSFASVFAMIASAFTRDPMTNALNASAAAMQAKRDNNEFEYNLHYKAWEDNTNLAIKRFNMQHAAMQDAFKIADHDVARGQAKMLETLTRFQDEQGLALYHAGYYPEIMKLEESRASAIEKLARPVEQIQRLNNESQRIALEERRVKALENTPDRKFIDSFYAQYPDATTEEFAKAYDEFKQGQRSVGGTVGSGPLGRNAEHNRRYNEYIKDLDPNAPDYETKRKAAYERASKEVQALQQGSPLSEYQKSRIAEREQKTDAVVGQVERAIQMIEQAGARGETLTGALGTFGTLKEFAVGGLGGETPHAAFTQLIRTIQQEAMPIIKGTTRISADERKTVDTIVPGLGFLRSQEQVYNGLKQLIPILKKVQMAEKEEATGNTAGEIAVGTVVVQNGKRYQKQGDGTFKELE